MREAVSELSENYLLTTTANSLHGREVDHNIAFNGVIYLIVSLSQPRDLPDEGIGSELGTSYERGHVRTDILKGTAKVKTVFVTVAQIVPACKETRLAL